MTTLNKYEIAWQKALARAQAEGLKVVDYGWEQHVILDEKAGITYRYPRHDAGAAKLADEVAVLKEVHKQKWPILLPEIIAHNEVSTSYKYIAGEALTQKFIANLSQNDLQKIGGQLGAFLAQFHKLDPAIVKKKQTSHSTSLLEYYAKRIKGTSSEEFKNPALKVLDELSSAPKARSVVVHGDLHGPNLVIDPETKDLAGVIDLSEMEIGDPHHEFRKIFMTFPAALDSCLKAYEENGGQKLDKQTIKLWAYTNEWANACYYAENASNYTYQRAIKHLKGWGQL